MTTQTTTTRRAVLAGTAALSTRMTRAANRGLLRMANADRLA